MIVLRIEDYIPKDKPIYKELVEPMIQFRHEQRMLHHTTGSIILPDTPAEMACLILLSTCEFLRRVDIVPVFALNKPLELIRHSDVTKVRTVKADPIVMWLIQTGLLECEIQRDRQETCEEDVAFAMKYGGYSKTCNAMFDFCRSNLKGCWYWYNSIVPQPPGSGSAGLKDMIGPPSPHPDTWMSRAVSDMQTLHVHCSTYK